MKKTITCINLCFVLILFYYLFFAGSGPWSVGFESGSEYQEISIGFVFCVAGLLICGVILVFQEKFWYLLQIAFIILFLCFMKTDFIQRTILGYYPNSTFKILKEYKSYVDEHAESLKQLTDFMESVQSDTIYELEFTSLGDYKGFWGRSLGSHQKFSFVTPFDVKAIGEELGRFLITKPASYDSAYYPEHCRTYRVLIPYDGPKRIYRMMKTADLIYYTETLAGTDCVANFYKSADYRTNLFMEMGETRSYILDEHWVVRVQNYNPEY